MEEETVVKKTNEYTKNEIGHIAAFTCGILSIIFASIWYVGIIHGITAMVIGARTGFKNKSKLGKAGFILRNYRHISYCNNNVNYRFSINF